MVTTEQIEQECVRFEKELAAISEEILRQFPMSDYRNDVRSSRRHGRLLNYGRTRRRKQVFEKIGSQHGSRALSLYLKLALCCFIGDSLEKLDIKYALAASSTRRRLHEQGTYVPSSYAFISPRKQFLNWAERTQARAIAAQTKK